MNKIKIIVSAILRGALLLTPGAAFCWWAWSKAPAIISVLATVGTEAMFLFIYAFIVVAIRAAKDLKNKKTEESA
ncbi:MAG: hypothetical protein K2M14_07125 [Muribaculaceae bacterium]|nr:hypothetical protein [Muribaculaceae bacterium]